MGDLCREILPLMRKTQSQAALSRALGFSFNQVYRWESGKKRILWSEFLAFAKASGIDIFGIIEHYCLFAGPFESSDVIVKYFVGQRTYKEVAEALDCNRAQLSRWLSGAQEPPLKTILDLIDLNHKNLPQFIGAFVDISQLEYLQERYLSEKKQRDSYYQNPYIAQVKECFSLSKYKSLPRHKEGFLASYLGISVESERAAVATLEKHGLVRKVNGLYEVVDKFLSLSGDFDAACQVRRYWANEAGKFLESLSKPPERSLSGLNVFNASNEAMLAIRDEYNHFFLEVQKILERDRQESDDTWVMSLNIFSPSEIGDKGLMESN